MTNRNLDVWAIYRDPEHVLDALKIIANHKDEITTKDPLKLFVNCTSSFKVNGKNIGRYMDSLICSSQADIALCLSSARYTDENLGGISATPEDIAIFLEKNNIPYQIITGEPPKDDFDDSKIPEIWMVREEYVLRDSFKESREKGCTECVIYPDTLSKLSMGYYTTDGTYHEIWGLNFKGLIKTDNSWTLLIDENDIRNVSIVAAEKIANEYGFTCIKRDDPLEELGEKRGI